MNKQRRKDLDHVIDKLCALQDQAQGLATAEGEEPDQPAIDSFRANAPSELAEAVGMVEGLRDEEQDYYDNMPESLQGGEKGDLAQAACDAMDNASSALEYAEDAVKDNDLEEFCEQVQEAINQLEEAKA